MFLFPVLFLAAVFIYKYYVHHRDYWKRKKVPGPPPKLFSGNFKELADYRNPNVLVMREWTKKYGKVYGMSEGVRKVWVISDVDMLQDIFVKKFEYFYGRKNDFMSGHPENDPKITVVEAQGFRWKRLRTICSPTFTNNNLKKIANTVEDTMFEMMKLFDKLSDDDAINIHPYFEEYTMDTISRIAMGQKGSALFNNPMTAWCQMIFKRNLDNPIYYLMAGVPFIRQFIREVIVGLIQLQKSPAGPLFEAIGKEVDRRMEQRDKDAREGIEPGEPQDFIDLFLSAHCDDVFDDTSEYTRGNAKINRNLTKDEIIAQCMVFLVAGFDTTANALAYTSWLLATHPEKQKKLQDEVDAHCLSSESVPFETLGKLKYMEGCIKEALRLFPLATLANSRVCMKDITLGDYHIEKGDCIWADAWSIHVDKTLWGADAEDFCPERWLKDDQRHPMAWIPFGAGPRVCIGQRLAYMEAKLALIHILRRFTISSGPKTERNLTLIGSTTVNPESVTVYLKRR